jgi:hypothetical protein
MIAVIEADSMKSLKSKIAVGIDDLNLGRFQTYSDADFMQLADDVGRLGRIRLNALRLKVAAKVQKRK